MRGMIAVDDVIASLPKERQKKIAARGNELLEKVQRRMTLGQIRKGAENQPGEDGRGSRDWPDANIASGEAKGPPALHHAAHGRCDGRPSDNDCNFSRSGAGCPCYFSSRD